MVNPIFGEQRIDKLRKHLHDLCKLLEEVKCEGELREKIQKAIEQARKDLYR